MAPIRTIFVCILITASAAPLLVPAVFSLRRILIRLDMKEKLEQENLTTVSITPDDLHWHEQGKEIILDGRMFDVKEISRHGDRYIIRGLYDDDESALEETVLLLQQKEDERSGLSRLMANIMATPAELFLQTAVIHDTPTPASDKETEHLAETRDRPVTADPQPPRYPHHIPLI